MHFYFVGLFTKSTTKSMKMCLEVKKSKEKTRMELHVYAHDRCQTNLSIGWLVWACITFDEVITFFFWQYSEGQIRFGQCILAVFGAQKCFEFQYIVIR